MKPDTPDPIPETRNSKLETRNPRLETVSVFVFLAALYLAFAGDHYDDLQASDEWVMFQTTRALVERGSLRPELDERYRGQEAKYGLGQSLAAVPLYLLARALMPLLREGVSPAAVAFPLACATNALICAAIGAMFLAVARRLGYGRRPAITGALVVGTTTIIAVYSKSFFSEPLVALCLLGAVGALASKAPVLPTEEHGQNGYVAEVLPEGAWLRAGLWLTLAVLTRLDNVVVAPVFLAALWLGVRASRRREALRGTVLFLLPLLLVALFIVWTNYLRSGEWQLSGYGGETFSTSFLSGVFGLLFSPSHGLFWFSPPLAIALVYVGSFHRRHPRVCFVIFATVAVKLFVFAKWWNWFGGWSWGSRFLLPVVPLMMLALLDPLSRWPQLRRTEKALIVAVCGAGLLVQLCGVLVGSTALHSNTQFLAGAGSGRIQPIADREQLLIFSPPQSPLIGNWPIIAHGRLDWFGVRFGDFFSPQLLLVVFFILGIGLIVSAVGLVRAWHTDKPEQPGEIVGSINRRGGETASAQERPTPTIVPRAAWVLLLLNVIVFAVLIAAVRSNGLRRTEWAYPSSSQNAMSQTPSLDGAIYLDDTTIGPTSVAKRTTEWLGYLEIPLSGAYSFYVVSVGAFDFHLAGRPVLSNPADPKFTAGRRSLRADIELARGFHPLQFSYTPNTETSEQANCWRRQVHLYWTIPGGGEYEQVIGRAWFYPTMPGVLRRTVVFLYRLKMAFVIVSLLALWWIWLQSVLCASDCRGVLNQ